MISLSRAPVKTGADAALPFVSASAGAELPTGPATGVAPENLHAQQELQHGFTQRQRGTQCSSCSVDVGLCPFDSPSETEAALGAGTCDKLCRFSTARRLVALPFVTFDHDL